ncbi:response regulator transcription factor [Sediminicola luteus]|uniref:Phosphate regulon transcriptional regulatory protein PhoB n=1 Tax=Sediminicola luteus TaxID=319238 RepID=A0A2A4G6W9_9FLAO|nr:response regulator transcription factor [Sediminicola luteus]PCE64183.1 DNA-binding response regulator [Sediminicola luteus]
MKQILIIEDDPAIVELLEIHLQDQFYTTSKALDGILGLDMALKESFDLIILDLNLPGMDGVEVCKRIRVEKEVPIIMLTAKSEEIDRVLGLEIGADDYITKPFSVREFMARVKAVMRRSGSKKRKEDSSSVMDYNHLLIDIDKRKVVLEGNRIELSPKEFELLALMAAHPGKNYSRTELLNLIWGYNFEGYEHTVNSHINRLRAKIEKDMSHPQYILTSWGVGYKFNEDMTA